MKKVKKITLLKKFYPYVKNTSLDFKLYSLLKFRNEKPHIFNNQIRINTNFPPYPSKPFDKITDIILNQKRIPHTIDFAITSNCPYKCPHCSYGNRKKKDLDTKQIIKLIQEIIEMGTAIFGITGGEPMLRPDLENIIEVASPELNTIIYTTGFNFNKKRAEKFYKANIGSIIIGIDSTNPEIQDKTRGKKGSLQHAINALKICNEVGIYSGINTIATRERINNGELERIYDLATSLDVGELRLNFPVSTGGWVGCTNKQLKNEELEQLIKIQKKLNKKRPGPSVTTLAIYESEDFLGCNTGYQTLFIDSSGEVCPCDFTPLSFGNIKNKSLKDIWKQMEEYFPRPRASCLMREISSQIKKESLPLKPNESKKLIPKLNNEDPFPIVYRKLNRK